jgi:transcriptional regulator with XRE-family HTH domain
MKAKSFQQYLEKRLNKAEIAEIEIQAKLEADYLKSLQEDVSKAVAQYMSDEKIGFNELVRRLNITPTQVSNIQSGKANLTLATIAHILH